MNNITNKEVGVRFTDDKYAKKEDVKKELNTSLIDPVWVKIYSYRAKFNKSIPLNNISKLSYFICNTPAIVQKSNEVNVRLLKCLTSFNNLNPETQIKIKTKQKENIIRYIALYYGETITSDAAKAIMSNSINNLQGISEAKQKANKYFNAHEGLANVTPTINQDYLMRIYVNLTGKDNLTSLYRNFNFEMPVTSYTHEYNGVPSNFIERMMDNFYRFLQDERTPILIKACSAYFFINFVKPFDTMNEEIALLVFKSVLALDHYETISFILPFESFLVKHKEFEIEFKEVARGSDMTYALIKCISVMNDVMDDFLDECTNTHIDLMVKEHHQEVVEPSIINNEPVTSEVKAQTPVTPHIEIRPSQNIAINKIEASLDEKDANKFEKYLLEKDPNLKAKQAHFFARHCTLGSYYTIQMYKKKERVVYETARTSMDSLTNLGYYRKEQIKNKFVYTPNKINRK